MISLFALLVLSAEPSHCREDLACFLAELKTCGPATYADPNLDPLGTGKQTGVLPLGVTEYAVAPGSDGGCLLTVQTRVDAIELSARLVSELGQQAPKKRSTALQAARDDGVLRRCAMSPAQLQQALELKRKGGSDGNPWSACKPVGCPEVLPADSGCVWSDCQDATRVLTCSVPPKELRCAAWSASGQRKPGAPSLRLLDHLEDPRPCVARCKEPNGEAEVVCR